MKYTLYENPVTRKFALLRLPDLFADGDSLPMPDTARWFDTRDDAIRALPDLLDLDDGPEPLA